MINWNNKIAEATLKQFEQDFTAGNFSHTVLISGNDNAGIFDLAKDLAMLLGCEKGTICGECNFCKSCVSESNLDVFEFANDGEKDAGIEEIRNLKNTLQLTSTAKARVVIIQNVERLSIPSLNALLKILEEPPSKVYFILTTRNHRDLLPTIVSRARIFNVNTNSEQNDSIEFTEKFKHLKTRADAIMLAEEMSIVKGEELRLFFEAFVLYLKQNGKVDCLEDAQMTYNLITQNVNARIAMEVLFLRYIGKCSIV